MLLVLLSMVKFQITFLIGEVFSLASLCLSISSLLLILPF